jgi:hypothetical protein
MDPAKKKPSLALVVSTGKGKPASKSDGDSYGAAVDELADVLGVADDKMEDFKAAFEAAVRTCK